MRKSDVIRLVGFGLTLVLLTWLTTTVLVTQGWGMEPGATRPARYSE